MKSLSMLALVALSLPTIANVQFDKAMAVFAKRGEDRQFAAQAAQMFNSSAASERTTLTKAKMKVGESRAYYFLGRTAGNKNEVKAAYEKGYNTALEAVAMLSTGDAAFEKDLAMAHYYYAANLGKWGEANGVFSSLAKWPILRESLDVIDSLSENAQSIESYGAKRTRGRALHKLPFGDKNEALKLLKYSFENSRPAGFDMSASTSTTLYYLDILVKTNSDVDTFCEVYEMVLDLSDMDDEELKEELTDLNPNLVPEGMIEIRQFGKGEGFFEKVGKYADKKCDL